VRRIIFGSVLLSLALWASEACAAEMAAGSSPIEIASNHSPGHAVHDLGLLPPPTNSDNPTPGPESGSKTDSADPIPELPTWAMMLVCFIGLALAGYKKGRKDRLSPGIE
jgi:hypothetical protein